MSDVTPVEPSPAAPKFSRPKILVVDAPGVAEHLVRSGYRAADGTFGPVVSIDAAAGHRAIATKARLPNYTEQEIVVVDLGGPAVRPAREDDFENPDIGVQALWAPLWRGRVDLRLPAIRASRKNFDRVHAHGGVFVLFADDRTDVEFVTAARAFDGSDFHNAGQYAASNWDVVSVLSEFRVRHDRGDEITLADNGVAEQLGLGDYLRDANFNCVLSPLGMTHTRWVTLATSKYGDAVAGIIKPADEGEGWIFVLPRVKQPAEVVRELVAHVLPDVAPKLFPDVERERWTRRPEYELSEVLVTRELIESTMNDARARVRLLEEDIARERQRSGFLHDLLTATADELVQAVIAALRELGFTAVHDVDAERAPAGDDDAKREDVRIMDAAVPVLIEVKGIGGMPKEAASLQVAKYLTPRMRQWGRTDLRGLSIVNHQRSVPALDREHENVFQQDVMTNAEAQGFGLLTTWDLYRLVRSFRALGWRHEHVAGLFTTVGRVAPVPLHYEFIGHIDGYWERAGALALRVEHGGVAVGDRVAFEFPVEFVEEDVGSLQLDGADVALVGAPVRVGMQTSLSKPQVRNGLRVFRICDRTS